jgi:hypothetical protein
MKSRGLEQQTCPCKAAYMTPPCPAAPIPYFQVLAQSKEKRERKGGAYKKLMFMFLISRWNM